MNRVDTAGVRVFVQDQQLSTQDSGNDLALNAQNRVQQALAEAANANVNAYEVGAQAAPAADEKSGGIDGALEQIRQGFDRIFHPDSVGSFLHAFPQLAGGGVKAVGGVVSGLFTSGADYGHCLVEGIPVLENIVQPVMDLFGGIGSCISSMMDGIGDACDHVGGAIESLCDGDLGGFLGGLGDAGSDVIGGAADAVGDAVDAVGDAIGDVFSGW